MILKDIEAEIERTRQGDFVLPRYGDWCFSSIPPAAASLLGAGGTHPLSPVLEKACLKEGPPRKVVLLLVDGFGYNQWLRCAADHGFLARLTERGTVAPLTSVFPSTTAATLTTIHSGLTPQEHGLPEWWVYLEELDRIIVTLPFMPLGSEKRDGLLEMGANPSILFDGTTFAEKLAATGIPSFAIIRRSYAHSAYSGRVHRGSRILAFSSVSEFAARLVEAVQTAPTPSYVYAYWDTIDSVAHEHGPHAEQCLVETAAFFRAMEEEFLAKLGRGEAGQSVLLVTSDHGQVEVDPQETIHLNDSPGIVRDLRTDGRGAPIGPWGSPRDAFLAVREEARADVLAFLRETLGERAAVLESRQALADGLFGRGEPHPRFRGRIGDILILPRGNNTVWYEHIPGKRMKLRGLHGGLSSDEMLIPFAAARLSDLR